MVVRSGRSFKVCSGFRAPQFRKRPRPCSISGVCAKIIFIIYLFFKMVIALDLKYFNFPEALLILKIAKTTVLIGFARGLGIT